MRDGSLTKKRIERCALTLFVDKGIHATTIKDIAGAAQVAEGALYRHYESKEDLAKGLFVGSYSEFIQNAQALVGKDANLSDGLKHLIEYFCKCFDEDQILFHYLLISQHSQVREVHKRTPNIHTLLAALLERAMSNGEISKQDPARLTAVIMGIVLQAAIARVYGMIGRTMIDDADFLVKTTLRALGL